MPSLKNTLALIRSDALARLRYEQREVTILSVLGVGCSPAFLGVTIWRFEHFLASTPLRPLNKLLKWINVVFFAMEIEPEAKIGAGFIVLNPAGIMIHGHTEIGKNNVWAHQITTTLGPRIGFDPENDFIKIGDGVTVHAGVRIIGDLTIASGSWIAPNTVVSESIPAQSHPSPSEASP